MLSISRKLSVLSIALFALVFFGCATLGGGNDFDDNIPTEDEMIEAKCEREGLEMVEKGAVYVTGVNHSFGRTVDVYLVGRNGARDLIKSDLTVGQEFGPVRVHGFRNAGTAYFVLEHVGKATTLRHQPAQIGHGRATLLVLKVGSSNNTPFGYSTVESHSIICISS